MKQVVGGPEQLGKILRGERQAQGVSQQEIASKVGMRQKTVSALELDGGRSTLTSLFRLLSALDLAIVIQRKSDLSNESSW
ncbi:helix-turn-helix domain-containing protein [bacterium]|nr:helix-turn-helix domain-containing protein [bacterium]